MKNSELRSLARETYKKNLPPVCLANAFSFAVQVVSALIPFGIGMLLILPIAEYYECSMALDVARGEHKGVISPLRKIPLLKVYGVVFLASILMILGFLLLIVPGIAVASCFSMMLYILKDNKEMSVFQIIKTTWQVMKGFKLQVFMNTLRLSLITIALEIPYIATIAIVAVAHSSVNAAAYFNETIVMALSIGLMSYATLAALFFIFNIIPKYHLTLAHFYEQNIKPQIKGDK